MQRIFLMVAIYLFGLSAFSKNHTLKGTFADQSNKPIDYADVLMKTENELINSTITDIHGNFSLQLTENTYQLILRQLGDTIFTQTVQVDKDIDLGKIQITITKELQEVIVYANQNLIYRKADLIFRHVATSC